MNSLSILCVVLLSSGFAWSLKESLGSNHVLAESCDSTISVGKDFEFNYKGVVEHTDAKHQTTGIQIQCQKSVITTVAPCTGRMKLKNCRLFSAGRPASKLVQRRVRKLTRYPVYFNTQKGENTKVFVHGQEDEFQVNIKKAILSALSLNTVDMPGVGGEAMTTTRSIFGETQTHVVRNGDDSVTTTRKLKGEMADSILRLPGLNFAMLAEKLQQYASLYLSPQGTQVCNYQLSHDNVEAVTCRETRKSVGAVAALGNMGDAVGDVMDTVVTQTVKFTKLSSASSLLPSNEVAAIKKSFVSDSLAFTSTLDQLDSMISRDGYKDAVEIIGSLEDDVDSAAIGNLQIWMASQSESTMTKLMSAVSENKFWKKLVTGCINLNWCKGEHCQASAGCQKVLGDMIVNSGDAELLALAAGIDNPTEHLLESLLTTASENPTSANVLALGKALNQFLQRGNGDGSAAQGFLEGVISSGCASSGSDSALVSAIKSVAAVEGRNLEQFANCLQASHVGDAAKFALVQALNSQETISNRQARSALMNVLADSTRTVKLRIASFVALIMNNPSAREVSAIVNIAQDPSESHLFTHCLNTFLNGQVTLKDTRFVVLDDSTIEALMNSGVESAGELNYYNYHKEKSVMVPKVNKEVDVSVNVDTYTAAGALIPTIVDITVNADTQQFGKQKVIELRVDTGRLLPVANALLESEQYIISDALGHLLKMPMEQWIPYLARNQGFLTKTVMDNLALLHEKFSLVEEMNAMDRIPFFDLKVMGQRLTGANFVTGKKSSPIARALEAMKVNDAGVSFDTVLSRGPLVYQHAVPTTLGTPLVSYFKINSAAKLFGDWLAEGSKIMLNQDGQIGGQYNINVVCNVAFGQSSSIMREVGCGSEIQFEFELQDNGEARLTRTPTSVNFMAKMPENSFVTARIIEVQNAWASITGDTEALSGDDCARVDEYTKNDVVMTICHGPMYPRTATVSYSSDGSAYELNIDNAERQSGGNVVTGFVVTVSQTPARRPTQELVSFNADYVEAEKQLNLGVQVGGMQVAGVESKVTHTEEDEEETSEFELTVNVQGNDLVQITFSVTKEEASGSGWSWWGSDDNEETAYNYKFTGYVQYIEAELSISGSMESPDAQGEFEANLEVYVGSVLGMKVFEIDWQNHNIAFENGVQGHNVSLVIGGFNTDMIPVSSAGLWFFRSPDSGYDLLKIVGFPVGEPAKFLDLRQVMDKDGDSYTWTSVITTPKGQHQMVIDGTNDNQFSISSRALPTGPSGITYESTLEVEDAGSTKMSINDPAVLNVFGFDLTFTQSPEMSIEYSQIFKGLEVINFKQTYDKTCRRCSKTVIQTMNVEGSPDTRISFEKAPAGATLEASIPPFGNFEAGVNAVQTANGIKIVAKVDAPMFGSCKASATYEVDEATNTAVGFRNVSCNSQVLGVFSNNFGMTYTFEDNHDYWDFDSSISAGSSWQLDTSATWDISGQNRVMKNVATHREMTFNGRHVEADLSLDYQPRSVRDGSVAPYTLTISSSAGDDHSIDLFSRNPLIMEDYLSSVCGKSERCRVAKIDAEKEKYDEAMEDVDGAFGSVESKFQAVSDPAFAQLPNAMARAYLKNVKLGQAFFRGGVPYWTVVPPVILIKSLPDIHNQFAVIKNKLRDAVQVGPRQRFNFRVGPIKKGMEDALNGVYNVRDVVDNAISHPTDLSQNVGIAQKAISKAFSNSNQQRHSVPHHNAVGFAPSSGSALQLITFNNNNRAVPYGPAHCTWVAAADLNGGVASFVTGDSLIITLLDEVMKIGTDGSVSIFNNGRFRAAGSDFQFSMMQCSTGGSEVLNCQGVASNLRVYQNGGVMAWYSDLQKMNGGYNFRGLLGNPNAASSTLMPSMGSMQPTEENFINTYELSKDPACQVSRDATTHRIKKACRKAFKQFVGQVGQAELSAYQRACSAHANSANEAEPYTAMLASVIAGRE